jgi:hypothetical protein
MILYFTVKDKYGNISDLDSESSSEMPTFLAKVNRAITPERKCGKV